MRTSTIDANNRHVLARRPEMTTNSCIEQGESADVSETGEWELSFDRANVARQILESSGLSTDRVQEVVRRDAGLTRPSGLILLVWQRVARRRRKQM